jgi:hypothetical protein
MLGSGEQTYKVVCKQWWGALSLAGVGKWGKAVGGALGNPLGCPPPSMAFPHGPEGMSIPDRPLPGGEGQSPMLE